MIKARAALRIAAIVWVVSSPLAIPALACLQCCVDHEEAGASTKTRGAQDAAPACHRTATPEPAGDADGTFTSVCTGPVSAFLAALDATAIAATPLGSEPFVPVTAAAQSPTLPLHSSVPNSDSPPPRS